MILARIERPHAIDSWVDRDSGVVASIFNERNAAAMKMIAEVITVCSARGRKIGICGQAASDYPDFARFRVG